MIQNIHLFHLLKQQVLICAGIKYILPSDCRVLAQQIFTQTKLFVSETTLKRVYGFAQVKFETSLFTKNVLACFCGYTGWEGYLKTVLTGQAQQEGSMQANYRPIEKERKRQTIRQSKLLTEHPPVGPYELRRQVVAILELLNLFDLASVTDQQNQEIIQRLQMTVMELDAIAQRIGSCASNET